MRSPQPRDWSALQNCCAFSPRAYKLAQLLTEVVSAGDLCKRHVDCVFTGQAGLSVMDFMHRMCKYAKAPPEAVICCGLLVYRLLSHVSWSLDSYNAHRVIAAAFLVAEKTSSDKISGFTHHAKVFGIPTKELIILERALLTQVNWEICISPEEYSQFCCLLDAFEPRPKKFSERQHRSGRKARA